MNADTTVDRKYRLEIGGRHRNLDECGAKSALQMEERPAKSGPGCHAVTGKMSYRWNGRNFSQSLRGAGGCIAQKDGARVCRAGRQYDDVDQWRPHQPAHKFPYDGRLAMDTGGNRGLNLFPPMDALAEVR